MAIQPGQKGGMLNLQSGVRKELPDTKGCTPCGSVCIKYWGNNSSEAEKLEGEREK